ncbi:MAG: NADH-quinone oxidoreductase subunit D [Coriobacteriales bacterium]|nr:NADH-quinone oxidoreductase subunit D [Coriobacteriales bacterium]
MLGDTHCPVPDTLPVGLDHVPTGVDREQAEHLIVNFGPQHPSMHGVLRILGELDGEEMISGEVNIGYLHRGIEKLAESRRYDQVGTLLDRGDYIAGIHGELAFAMATEQLAEIEVPERALWIRTLVGEITRISSHLLWYGPMGLDAGAMGQFLYAVRDREMLLDILEAITGARMMFNYIRPGGVLRDLPAGIERKILEFLDHFEKMLPEHDDLLGGNEIFQLRTKGVGVIDRDKALAYSLTGANLRASGVSWDLRKDRPYAAYDKVEFDVPISNEGDIYSRYLVRMEEMRQSVRIIRQVLDGMPEGPHTAKVAKVLRPPAGEAYAAVEAPRGEWGIHIISNGSDNPARMRYRPPAFYALQVVEDLIPGTLLADMIVVAGSMDIVLGEIDR